MIKLPGLLSTCVVLLASAGQNSLASGHWPGHVLRTSISKSRDNLQATDADCLKLLVILIFLDTLILLYLDA